MTEITVYRARRVRTMNRSNPVAEAVAVREGRIVEVGSLATMAPWLERYPHRIDDTFADAVIMPGFIDPHLHPSMAALLLPCHFITAMEWKLPHVHSPAISGQNAFMDRLAAIEGRLADPAEPLISWGYHRQWHGAITRAALNAVSAKRPIILWHRSFHEIVANDAAVDWMKLDRAELARHPQIDVETGRFYETGRAVAMTAMRSHLLSPAHFEKGLEITRQVIHAGGHTTIGDLSYPMIDDALEWAALERLFGGDEVPFRTQLVPKGFSSWSDQQGDELARIEALAARNTDRLFFGNGVKLYADGGYFTELSQLGFPGYIDGHEGEWMLPPETLERFSRLFWNAGKRIHVHTTGDLGHDLVLDVLEKLQWERPRVNHRFTIEHFALATPEQCRRIADLGAIVSANPYYLHELGHAYVRGTLGHERASTMSRLATLKREGVTLALHSDFTMAPAQPLVNAWVAVNRLSDQGEVFGPEERLTVDEAMRAITIDAAYVLGMENEVGSLRSGKKADFTIVDQDPYEVDPMGLRDIAVLGTVFEGRWYPVEA